MIQYVCSLSSSRCFTGCYHYDRHEYWKALPGQMNILMGMSVPSLADVTLVIFALLFGALSHSSACYMQQRSTVVPELSQPTEN